jgi:hypothetical protein
MDAQAQLFSLKHIFQEKLNQSMFIMLNPAASASGVPQGCQIFGGTRYQNEKNIPNGHKIYQMPTKGIKWR